MKTKLLLAILDVVAVGVVLAGAVYGECSYCGSSSFGACPYSKVHKHTDYGADRCMFCGSSSYGLCSYSPHGKHEHGYGHGKCRFCGSSGFGSCSYSPSRIHEH